MLGLMMREVSIFWAMCRNNLGGVGACFFGGLVPRFFIEKQPMETVVTATLRTSAIVIMWVYAIDICNTTTSVQEDMINKPHRPIPSGLITVEQSRMRWLVSWAATPLVAFITFGPQAASYFVMWEIWLTFFYVWPAHEHWFLKAVMAAGPCMLMLGLLNVIVQETTPWRVSPYPDIIISLWTLVTIHVQDFRDVEGDRNSHNNTLPLILSERGLVGLRWGTAFAFALSCFISAFWIWTRACVGSAYLTGVLFYITSGVLAYYTVIAESLEDRRKLYSWWMGTGFFHILHVYNLTMVS